MRLRFALVLQVLRTATSGTISTIVCTAGALTTVIVRPYDVFEPFCRVQRVGRQRLLRGNDDWRCSADGSFVARTPTTGSNNTNSIFILAKQKANFRIFIVTTLFTSTQHTCPTTGIRRLPVVACCGVFVQTRHVRVTADRHDDGCSSGRLRGQKRFRGSVPSVHRHTFDRRILYRYVRIIGLISILYVTSYV